jgi:RNA dependent RNA polymerase
LDRGFYFTPIFEPYLGYIHLILQKGFFIGRGLRIKFLSYSNSQLKNHTFWFLADVENGLIDTNIIEAMGNFDNEKNILKKFARRG